MSEQKERTTFLKDDQREKLQKELEELYEWRNRECEKLEIELKKEGKWDLRVGLDLNEHYFKDIKKEFQKRFHALGVKYGLLSE
ncbi:MAG: hypothetical protein HFI92_06450 [Lachnospiraceae bacterium]|nr:hypothetical protein [Lachnospiraceae bacterium]